MEREGEMNMNITFYGNLEAVKTYLMLSAYRYVSPKAKQRDNDDCVRSRVVARNLALPCSEKQSHLRPRGL